MSLIGESPIVAERKNVAPEFVFSDWSSFVNLILSAVGSSTHFIHSVFNTFKTVTSESGVFDVFDNGLGKADEWRELRPLVLNFTKLE